MALTVDSQMPSGAGVFTLAASPWTWSFTNTAGTVLYLILEYDISAAPTVTVTYGGTSMTQVGSVFSVPLLLLFRLTSPPTGANNFVVTFSGTGGSGLVIACAISFTGNAATPDSGTAASNNWSGTTTATWPVTVAPTTTGNIVIQGVCYGDPAHSTQTGTLSSVLEHDAGGNGNNLALQYQASAASSTTPSITGTTATSFATLGIQVLAAAGATTDQIMAAVNRPTNTPVFQRIGSVVY